MTTESASTKPAHDQAPPLQRDISWLRGRLDEIQDGTARKDVDRLRAIVDRMRATGTTDPGLADFDLASIRAMLKRLGTAFHLRNKAEQVHIVRVNRLRERDATLDAPRAESLAEAIGVLHAAGFDLEATLETI